MKDVIKRVLVLGIVAILSALALSSVYDYAKPRIAENEREAVKASIYNIASGSKKYVLENISNEDIYFCYGKEDNLVGYVFKADGMGYQGQIIIMVGLDEDLSKLTGIQILKHSETPGLGAKIVTEKFRKQFKNLTIYPVIEYTKSRPYKQNQIKAITGATVTSEAIVNILNSRIKKVIKALGALQ